MNSTGTSFDAHTGFTIETLSQLAFYNGFAIYRSSMQQIPGSVLICGEPDSNMLERIIVDKSIYHIIIPDEDRAREMKNYFVLREAGNVHIYDCSADELPFKYTSLCMAFVKTDTRGLNNNFYSEMYRCLNLES